MYYIQNIYSDQNSQVRKYENKSGTEVFTWYRYGAGPIYYNYSTTDQLVNFDVGNTGNRSIYVRAENAAAINSSWVEVDLFVDEENPTLNLQTITEINMTWTIYSDVVSGNGTLAVRSLDGLHSRLYSPADRPFRTSSQVTCP